MPSKNTNTLGFIGNAFAIFGEINTAFQAIQCVVLACIIMLIGIKLFRVSVSETTPATVYGFDDEGLWASYYDKTGIRHDAFVISSRGSSLVPGQRIEVVVDPETPGIVMDRDDSYGRIGIALVLCALFWMFMAYYIVSVVYSRENVATLVGGVSAVSALV